MSIYEVSLFIASIGFAYSVLLTEENAIFNGAYNRLYVWFKTDQRAREGKGVHPVFMILMYCGKCVAGQISFWFYLYKNWSLYTYDCFDTFIMHFGFVSLTIIITAFLHESYKYIKHINP